MPGHKGKGPIGAEALDITEISGADSLYEADGIIRQSEDIASKIFGCSTYYSAEGSSLAIRAMLYLAFMHAKKEGKVPLVAAGRNAHKTFMSAAALLDIDVMWLWGEGESYLSCVIDASSLDKTLASCEVMPFAVYITSPDYLGNVSDVASLAKVCRKYGILLLVDNAHGAYLKFLDRHPIELGAHMCADSAHKTLGVLTGGAYLHIESGLAPKLGDAKQAMVLFGSTSPSYLILQSLDAANGRVLNGYREELAAFCEKTKALKAELEAAGYVFSGDEPIKLTLLAKKYGYTGTELADILRNEHIECEFADSDHLVLMLTPDTGDEGLERLKNALLSVQKRAETENLPPRITRPRRVMSVREATFAVSERVLAKDSAGRVLAAANVGCPPAVPIVACGEEIDESAVRAFEYYGIEYCQVIK